LLGELPRELVLAGQVVLVLLIIGSGSLDRPQVIVLVVLLLKLVLILVLVLVCQGGLGGRRGCRPGPCPAGRGLGVVLRHHVLGAEDVGGGQQLRRGRGAGAAVAVRSGALGRGQQRGERARQRADLVTRQHGAVGQGGLRLGQQSLEPEQEREFAAPGRRRAFCLRIRLKLRERLIERAPAGRAGGERDRRILAFVHEPLADELLRARDLRGTWNGRGCECR